MRKTFFVLLLALFTTVFVTKGDEFKIIKVHKDGIRIGSIVCHEGDKFNDTEHIYWTRAVKWFDAKNMATSKFKRFSENHQNTDKSPKDYYTKITGLTSRFISGSKYALGQLMEMLNDTYVLESQLSFPTEEKVDEQHYFVLRQSDENGEKVYRLPATPGKLLIERSLFESAPLDSVNVAVDYINEAKNGSLRLSDSLKLIFWTDPKISQASQEE